MKNQKVCRWIFFLLVFSMIPVMGSTANIIWENFDSHKWNATKGTDQPTLDYDKKTFPGRTVLKMTLNGSGDHGYAFAVSDWFSAEDWSSIAAVKLDVFYDDPLTGNEPKCKLEIKDPSGKTIEAIFCALPKKSWQTLTFPLNKSLNYSAVGQLWLTLDVFKGYKNPVIYYDNLKLVEDIGTGSSWDNFEGNIRDYTYGGCFDTKRFINAPMEVRSHRQASPTNPALSGYLAWNYKKAVTYVELADQNINQDWSMYNSIKIDVYTNNTNARYKVFCWDATAPGIGYAPISQKVTNSGQWTTLNFDFSPATVNKISPGFHRNHINEFKCVVEYLDLPGAGSGECYFDNVVLSSDPVTN